MDKIKLSFKKHGKYTGLSSIGRPHAEVDIKINKKVVGSINPPTWQDKDNLWSVSLTITKKNIMEDGNSNCPWKRITFKKKFESEDLARNFVKENIERFSTQYKLHALED